MIRQLRRKFILISMCAVVSVLLILLIGINVANVIRVDRGTDDLLALLTENEGSFPLQMGHRPKPFSPETPFETRYFSVQLNTTGQIEHINLRHIAAVSQETAETYTEHALSRKRGSGYIDVYKYAVTPNENGTLVLFLDRERELSTLRSFMLTSLYIFLIGIAAIFVLILLLSRLLLRPVIEGYDRQKQFITDASHELKTPLTIIDANAEVLALEHGDNDWLQSIRHQTERLASLTNSLTALCRMEETDSARHLVDFSLSDAVHETLKLFETPARTQNKPLHIIVEDGITLHGDERAIRQLVSLLADNAVKYATENTPIYFSLSRQNKRCVLMCRNTADGITPGNYDRLFERFYRGDPARSSNISGSGIGLSIAKAIVESMNGRITAYSEDGITLCVVAWL